MWPDRRFFTKHIKEVPECNEKHDLVTLEMRQADVARSSTFVRTASKEGKKGKYLLGVSHGTELRI